MQMSACIAWQLASCNCRVALRWPVSVAVFGPLKYGSGTRMSDWMLTHTCRKVLLLADQFSPDAPAHVLSKDKQTLPQLYRFGLNRTLPPPVVCRLTRGGVLGYSLGKNASN